VHVQLRDVDVQAAGTSVLSAITLTITPGEHVAFVGASGAGKSTICGLLLGWVTQASGVVTIDGRPLDAFEAVGVSGLGGRPTGTARSYLRRAIFRRRTPNPRPCL
jgi:ABC-type bacteriocin/lantibiotic exporter with double-glycine peptidase domain